MNSPNKKIKVVPNDNNVSTLLPLVIVQMVKSIIAKKHSPHTKFTVA